MTWVAGATMFAKSTYFTGMAVTFTVPTAPPDPDSSTVITVWPGLEDVTANNAVLQTVLEYGFQGTQQWQMQNYVVNGSTENCSFGAGASCDAPKLVNAGDVITSEIFLDSSNPGKSCNLATGTNCNYVVLWFDWNTSAQSILPDWNQPNPLKWAQGLILEVPISNATSCNSFPVNTNSHASVQLWEYATASLYTEDTVVLTQGNAPTYPFSFDFGNQSVFNPAACNFADQVLANNPSQTTLFFIF